MCQTVNEQEHTTTLARYAGQRAGNYCTLPRIDVPILPEVHHCAADGCDLVVTYRLDDAHWAGGQWVHEGTSNDLDHWVSPRPFCLYCHAEDGIDGARVTFDLDAWADMTRCSRCGGEEGRAIGD